MILSGDENALLAVDSCLLALDWLLGLGCSFFGRLSELLAIGCNQPVTPIAKSQEQVCYCAAPLELEPPASPLSFKAKFLPRNLISASAELPSLPAVVMVWS